MNIRTLKAELESALMITKWSPTDNQLFEIAKKLKDFKGKPTKSNIEKIVLDVVGTYQGVMLEGVDNSDLTTLLMLATKVDSVNDK
ncbi:MAG: hypothetical protein ACKN9W_08305 [Methylococcus sp.]